MIGATLVIGALSFRVRDGRRHLALLAVVAVSASGVLMSRHLIVVLACWQTMVLAVAMVLARGDDRAGRAASRFAAVTLAGTFSAAVAIVALGAARGTFDLDALAARPVSAGGQALPALLLSLPFIIALPLFPLHGWAVRAHAAAPASAALLLSGIVGVAAIYGILRICMPLFPQGMATIAPALVALAAVGVLYASIVAARATDARRFIACAGLCLLDLAAVALFAGSPAGLRAAALVAVSHALVAPALLLLTSRDTWRSSRLAWLGIATVVGVPGTSGFAAVSMALVAAWEPYPLAAVVAGTGIAILGWAGLRLAASSRDDALRGLGDHGGRRAGLLAAPLLAASIAIGVAPSLVTDRVPADPGSGERVE